MLINMCTMNNISMSTFIFCRGSATGKNWMKYIADNKRIYQLTIPGKYMFCTLSYVKYLKEMQLITVNLYIVHFPLLIINKSTASMTSADFLKGIKCQMPT